MTSLAADVLVLGSGFGGSLTTLLLHQAGLRPVLVDRGAHPRFAIGESSTPIADAVLRHLANQYRLPRLTPLTRFSTWRETYPELVCGLKRGFSYFHHVPGEPFVSQANHANELLVAASSSDALADTHWLRSDVDAFLAGEVQAAGIGYLDRCEAMLEPHSGDWRLHGTRQGEEVQVTARFVIDATGDAGVVLKTLGIRNDVAGLATHSRALFAHFADLRPWQPMLEQAGGRTGDHPFACDDAALHQVIDEGWMWQLRFANGITSAGFVLDCRDHPLDTSISADEEWKRLLDRYPSLARQFAEATIVAPQGGLRRTGRFQRRAAQMAGDNWALLPYTAGFIDPLHSTGIAHTLCGIERLVTLLSQHWDSTTLADELQEYQAALRREITLIDQLVSGCYRTRRHFPLFVAFAMLYFVGATTYERLRWQEPWTFSGDFLSAHDAEFCGIVSAIRADAERLVARGTIGGDEIARFESRVASAIAPYNRIGLFNPAAQNMYWHTAAPGR